MLNQYTAISLFLVLITDIQGFSSTALGGFLGETQKGYCQAGNTKQFLLIDTIGGTGNTEFTISPGQWFPCTKNGDKVSIDEFEILERMPVNPKKTSEGTEIIDAGKLNMSSSTRLITEKEAMKSQKEDSEENPLDRKGHVLIANHFLPAGKRQAMTFNLVTGKKVQIFSQPGMHHSDCSGLSEKKPNKNCQDRLNFEIGSNDQLYFNGPSEIKVLRRQNPYTKEFEAHLYYKVKYTNTKEVTKEYWVNAKQMRDLTEKEINDKKVHFENSTDFMDSDSTINQPSSQRDPPSNCTNSALMRTEGSKHNMNQLNEVQLKVDQGSELKVLLDEMEKTTSPFCEKSQLTISGHSVRGINLVNPIYNVPATSDSMDQAKRAKSSLLKYWHEREKKSGSSRMPQYKGRSMSATNMVAIELLARTVFGEIESCYSESRGMAVAKTILNRAVHESKTFNGSARIFAFNINDPDGKQLNLFGKELQNIIPHLVYASRWNKKSTFLGWQYDPWNPKDINIKKVICPPRDSEDWQNAVKIAARAINDMPDFWSATENIRDFYYTNGVSIPGLKDVETASTTIGGNGVQEYGCLVLKRDFTKAENNSLKPTGSYSDEFRDPVSFLFRPWLYPPMPSQVASFSEGRVAY